MKFPHTPITRSTTVSRNWRVLGTTNITAADQTGHVTKIRYSRNTKATVRNHGKLSFDLIQYETDNILRLSMEF